MYVQGLKIHVPVVLLLCFSRKEWLEMRGIFRNLQKEKVREMKQQLKEEGGATGGGRADKGFVARCLVKVEGVGRGEGEEVVTIEKVQVCMWVCMCVGEGVLCGGVCVWKYACIHVCVHVHVHVCVWACITLPSPRSFLHVYTGDLFQVWCCGIHGHGGGGI